MKKMKKTILISLITSIIVNLIYIILKNIISSCDLYEFSAIISLIISAIIIFIVVINNNIEKNNVCFVIFLNLFNYLIIELTSYIPYPMSDLITRCDGGLFSGMGYAIYFVYNFIVSVGILILSSLIRLFIRIINKKRKM